MREAGAGAEAAVGAGAAPAVTVFSKPISPAEGLLVNALLAAHESQKLLCITILFSWSNLPC